MSHSYWQRGDRRPDERDVTAYHEAGHAVASVRLRRGISLVTIQADGALAGRCVSPSLRRIGPRLEAIPQTSADIRPLRRPLSREDAQLLGAIRREMTIRLAGPISQRSFYERTAPGIALAVADYGTERDRQQVADFADVLCRLAGRSSPGVEVRAAESRARELIVRPESWEAVTRTAQALLSSGTLSGRMVRRLVFGR